MILIDMAMKVGEILSAAHRHEKVTMGDSSA